MRWHTAMTSAIVEVCPACASPDVRAEEDTWFAVELDRRAELREQNVRVEFRCRDCGERWG
ncbi:hypothetical protein [Microbacterium sp.]|uniref:hypothetical protein n=1 Tax=Microbacterium sp. TaxID=51671 RepID=UPI0037C52C07